jgi:hypothetical protein
LLLDVEVKKHRKKRSLDANAYCWILCQKIAEKLNTTKEEVYQKFVREVGQFEIVPIQNDKAQFWIDNWNSRGLGWFSEELSKSKIEGYTNIINYYGTSIYDSREMSLIIEAIVSEAIDLGIETMTPNELRRLIEQIENR